MKVNLLQCSGSLSVDTIPSNSSTWYAIVSIPLIIIATIAHCVTDFPF